MLAKSSHVQKKSRYVYIDALRGFAALWVVLYHLWNRYYPNLSTQRHPYVDGLSANPTTALAFMTFGYGYTGVTLFFVLSGLCIHLPQARSGEYTLSARTFANRRFWRLYPAYVASIVLSVVALLIPKVLLAMSGRSFDWWVESQFDYSLINAAFLQPIWPKSLELNGVYWTLVYEVQFYATYPALLYGLRNFGFLPVGLVLLAAEGYFALEPAAMPCLFPYKYFEWFLGVIAAEAIARRAEWISGRLAIFLLFAGLGAGMYSTFHPILYPLRDLLLAFGYFGLILFVAENWETRSPFFPSRARVLVGAFSYSLYLIHVPIIDVVWVGIDRLVARGANNPSAVRWLSIFAVPICLVISYAFFQVFERPFLHTKDAEPLVVQMQPLEEKTSP